MSTRRNVIINGLLCIYVCLYASTHLPREPTYTTLQGICAWAARDVVNSMRRSYRWLRCEFLVVVSFPSTFSLRPDAATGLFFRLCRFHSSYMFCHGPQHVRPTLTTIDVLFFALCLRYDDDYELVARAQPWHIIYAHGQICSKAKRRRRWKNKTKNYNRDVVLIYLSLIGNKMWAIIDLVATVDAWCYPIVQTRNYCYHLQLTCTVQTIIIGDLLLGHAWLDGDVREKHNRFSMKTKLTNINCIMFCL